MKPNLRCYALERFPFVEPGDDLTEQLLTSLVTNQLELVDGDVIVIAQKIVSKSEDRYRYLKSVTVSDEAVQLSQVIDKDPRLVQCILDESQAVLRTRKGVIIVRHRNGYVHANAGIDQSNIENCDDNPRVLLLPVDPDKSAAKLQNGLQEKLKIDVKIIINDSAGRPWRNGITGFAIGVAGFVPVDDKVGSKDLFGQELQVTQIAVADELAATASFIMGQCDEGLPVVVIRGAQLNSFNGGSDSGGSNGLIRPIEEDLFT